MKDQIIKEIKRLRKSQEFFKKNLWVHDWLIMDLIANGIDQVGHMSGYLNCTNSNVSQFIRKLYNDGFVTKIKLREDARNHRLLLTDKGKTYYQQLSGRQLV